METATDRTENSYDAYLKNREPGISLAAETFANPAASYAVVDRAEAKELTNVNVVDLNQEVISYRFPVTPQELAAYESQTNVKATERTEFEAMVAATTAASAGTDAIPGATSSADFVPTGTLLFRLPEEDEQAKAPPVEAPAAAAA